METGRSENGAQLCCSFCGKSQKVVRKLIAGPTVYICDDCTFLCNEIIAEERKQQAQAGASNTRAAEQARAGIACSFCRKPYQAVRHLIAGPTVYICDECIARCNAILRGDEIEGPGPAQQERRDRLGSGKWNIAIVPAAPRALSLHPDPESGSPLLMAQQPLLPYDKHDSFARLVPGRTFDRYVAAASSDTGEHALGGGAGLPGVRCELLRLRHALRKLSEVLAALHDVERIHRDLRPDHVLVTDHGVSLLEFGTLIEEQQSQSREQLVGTPAYMSPEQAARRPATSASDWYAVGAMLFEALTGRLPFEGTVAELLRMKAAQDAPLASSLVTGVPVDLDRLCCDLLRRDPRDRPDDLEMLHRRTA